MRKFITTLLGAIALIAGIFAVTGTANATTAITGTTQITAQPDTTSGGTGTGCDTTSAYAKTYGPVWAYDNFGVNMTAIPTGKANTWSVTINSSGSFAGFADPTTCDASLSKGDLSGTITYIVTSLDTPSQSNLAASYTDFPTNLNGLVAAFFGDPTLNTASFGDGTYSYSYQDGNYVQDSGGISGDVVSNGGAVTGIAVAPASATSVTLSWDATPGATSYQYSVTAFGINGPNQTTAKTSVTIGGLVPGTQYNFFVSAEPSAEGNAGISYTVPTTPPPPATDVVTVTAPHRVVVRAGRLMDVLAHAASSLGYDGWTWKVSSNHPIPDFRISGGAVKGRPHVGAYNVTITATDNHGGSGNITIRVVARG